MITYRPTENLATSAKITYKNMRSYYEHYSVDWQQDTIEEQIQGLENWDILYNGILIGAIRLAFENEECYIRDLQIDEAFQNKGFGAAALAECERLALQNGVKKLKLRVFKISPAVRLYERNGFSLNTTEDRFYYLSRQIHVKSDT